MLKRWLLSSLILIIAMGSLWNSGATPSNAAEKPPLLYLALGDSLTAGLGSTVEKGMRPYNFVAQVAKGLKKDYAIKAKNLGIPGWTSQALVQQLETDTLLRNALRFTDLVTITIGGNDVLPFYRQQASEEQFAEAIILWKKNTAAVIDQIHSINPDTTVLILELYNPLPVKDPDYERGENVVKRMNQELIQLVSERAKNILGDSKHWVYTVSVEKFFYGKSLELTHIIQGDVHPNNKGYRVMAEQVLKALASLDE
jgi:lysophospholipase L1-like esterase